MRIYTRKLKFVKFYESLVAKIWRYYIMLNSSSEEENRFTAFCVTKLGYLIKKMICKKKNYLIITQVVNRHRNTIKIKARR